MDTKLLLVKCICLLYKESQLENPGQSSRDLCQQVADTIVLPEASLSVHSGREVLSALRTTLYWMIDHVDQSIEEKQLMQRLRVDTRDDTYLYNALCDGMGHEQDQEKLKSEILSYRSELYDYLGFQAVSSMVGKAYKDLYKNADYTRLKAMARQLMDELEPYTHDNSSKLHHSVVDVVDFDDPGSLEKALTKAKEELTGEGSMQLGWQALNRFLGAPSGFRRGEFVVVGALQYNFKSGFCLNLFKHLAMYNTPYMRDETKKPLLIHFSLENEMSTNISWLYTNIRENETGEQVDISGLSENEMAAYIRDKMQATGYSIAMRRIDPNNCTYHDLIDMITQYETDGFEIHAAVIDYLSMLSKEGLTHGATGSEIRDLFRRTRNFCTARGITCITPHQLSTEAKMLIRQGQDNFLEQIKNKGYWDSCKTIDQEVDLEIYLHIVEIPGQGSYLMVQRGKHRGVDRTPTKHQSFCIPFHDAGGIRDDFNGADGSMPSPGGRAGAGPNGEALAWYDL